MERPHSDAERRLAEVLGLSIPERVSRGNRSRRACPATGNVPSSGTFWIGICGPFAMTRNGMEVRALPEAQRTVLALLALAAGSAVPAETLIAALWPADPPASARAIVHTYISRLRAWLETDDDDRSLITRDGSGYRLHLSPEQLDLLVFRQIVSRAREAPDAETACDFYEQAMDLWRGDPLADVSTLHGHPAVTALADEHVVVTLEYAERAAAGRQAAVLPHLKRLAVSSPLDERLHAALMIALAGSGQQAESLRVYEDLRHRLDEELGVLPGEELRHAHQKVLRQQVSHHRPADTWREVHQLPAAPVDFTGRTAERDALIHSIITAADRPGVPVAVVSGQPGVGKTTLALYIAHAISELFPDGQLWAQLAGASARPRDPAEILGEMLRALGVPGPAIPDDQSARSAALRSALAGRKVLILADDAASTEQVMPLLPGTPGCALIVTSRVRLHGLPGATHVPLDVFATNEAIQFLSRLASHERVTADPAAATRLAQSCGGLPLALRIVGSRLAAQPQWPLSVMARKLTRDENRLRELEAGTMSVRASIDLSYLALPERDRLAFRRLALLGSNDFAGWVVGVLLGEPAADDVLDNLASRSLITSAGIDDTGEPRYRLHDLLRDYAAEQLAKDPPSDTESAGEGLLHAWLQLAQRADAAFPSAPYLAKAEPSLRPSVVPAGQAQEVTADSLAWFTSEQGNLESAIRRACEAGLLDFARDLATSIYSFHFLSCRYDAIERIWTRIGQLAQSQGAMAEGANASLRSAAARARRGRSAEAARLLDVCIEQFRVAEAQESAAFARYWRALCAWDLDDFSAARHHAERGLLEARQARSRYAELTNIRMVGLSLALEGEYTAAVEACEGAVKLASELGSELYSLVAVHSLALACCHAGQHERALKFSERALALSRRLGVAHDEVSALGVMSDSYLGLRRFDDAVGVLLQAWQELGSLQADRHQGLCLLKLGYAYEAMERHSDAIPCLDASLMIFRDLNLPRKIEQAQEALARCRALA